MREKEKENNLSFGSKLFVAGFVLLILYLVVSGQELVGDGTEFYDNKTYCFNESAKQVLIFGWNDGIEPHVSKAWETCFDSKKEADIFALEFLQEERRILKEERNIVLKEVPYRLMMSDYCDELFHFDWDAFIWAEECVMDCEWVDEVSGNCFKWTEKGSVLVECECPVKYREYLVYLEELREASK